MSANLRTSEGDDHTWRQQVETLSALANYIIFDAREESAFVAFEIDRVFKAGHLGKTVWIAHRDGSAPALDQFLAQANPDSEARIVKLFAYQVSDWCRKMRSELASNRYPL